MKSNHLSKQRRPQCCGRMGRMKRMLKLSYYFCLLGFWHAPIIQLATESTLCQRTEPQLPAEHFGARVSFEQQHEKNSWSPVFHKQKLMSGKGSPNFLTSFLTEIFFSKRETCKLLLFCLLGQLRSLRLQNIKCQTFYIILHVQFNSTLYKPISHNINSKLVTGSGSTPKALPCLQGPKASKEFKVVVLSSKLPTP